MNTIRIWYFHNSDYLIIIITRIQAQQGIAPPLDIVRNKFSTIKSPFKMQINIF